MLPPPPPSFVGHFWLLHVLSRWEKFSAAVAGRTHEPACVGNLFPFKEYFGSAPQPLFKGEEYAEVGSCWGLMSVQVVAWQLRETWE